MQGTIDEVKKKRRSNALLIQPEHKADAKKLADIFKLSQEKEGTLQLNDPSQISEVLRYIADNDIPTEEPVITATPTVAPTPEPTAEPTDETDNPDNPTENPDDQPEITPEPTEKPEETVEPVNNTPSTSQTHHYTLTMHINEEALKQWQNAFETIDQLVYVLEHK